MVLSGREVGVAEWVLSCVHFRGEGAEGMDDPRILWNDGGAGRGSAVDARCKDSCAYGIEGAG